MVMNLGGMPGMGGQLKSEPPQKDGTEPANSTADSDAPISTSGVNRAIGRMTGVNSVRVGEIRDANIDARNAALSAGMSWLKTKSGEGLTALKGKYDRWQVSRAADFTIRTNGEAINAAHSEIAGIRTQVLSVSPAEALRLRGRQMTLQGNIETLAAERQKAAGVLANYYGPKIEEPLRQADSYEASIQGLAAERLVSQRALENARGRFDAINRHISQLQQAGKLTTVGFAEMMQELQEFSSQIDAHTGKVAMQSQEIENVETKLRGLRATHGDKITLARQLRSMQADGRNRTLAEPGPVQRAGTEAPSGATPNTVTNFPGRTASSGENAASLSAAPESASQQINLGEIARQFASYLRGVPDRLRSSINGLQNKELLEQMDTKSIVARWNAVAEKSEPKLQKILGSEQEHLLEMLPSKVTLVDFGVMVRIALGREPEEIERGIMSVARNILDEGEAKKKAA